jgi:hypothetical protein
MRLELLAGAQTCPFCHGSLADGDKDLWICTVCATAHHADCARENRRCTVFGCTGTCESSAEPADPVGTFWRSAPFQVLVLVVLIAVPPLGVLALVRASRTPEPRAADDDTWATLRERRPDSERFYRLEEECASALRHVLAWDRLPGGSSDTTRSRFNAALEAYQWMRMSRPGDHVQVRAGLRAWVLVGPPPETDRLSMTWWETSVQSDKQLAEKLRPLGPQYRALDRPPREAEVDRLLDELDRGKRR